MDLKSALKDEYAECVHLITGDRKLQCFMALVFTLLVAVILGCYHWDDFGSAEAYYHTADRLLSGSFDYDTDGLNLPPLFFPVIAIVKLLTPNLAGFCILLSLAGFAFFMLGGHFLLKMCRETGYPEKDAYILLLLVFACALTDLTTGYASMSAAFVIIAIWLYRRDHPTLSFVMLALATWAGFYPVLMYIAVLIDMGRRKVLKQSGTGIVLYLVLCLPLLLLIPHIHLPDVTSYDSVMGWMQILEFPDISAITSLVSCALLGVMSCTLLSIWLRAPGIRGLDLILLISVTLVVYRFPYGDGYWLVTVGMLFILSRMGSRPSRFQNYEYIALAVYGITEFVCDIVIAEATTLYAAISIAGSLALIVFVLSAAKEFQPLSRFAED